MPAIDAEVSIGGKNDRIRKRFGHAHKAGVGEAHGHVCVFLQEPEYGLHVVVQIESGNQGPTAKQRAEPKRPGRAEKVEGFRQDRVTSAPGWSVARHLPHRPLVVRVAAAEQRHQEACVNERVSGHSPWLSSTASFVRSGRPASRPRSRRDRQWHQAAWTDAVWAGRGAASARERCRTSNTDARAIPARSRRRAARAVARSTFSYDQCITVLPGVQDKDEFTSDRRLRRAAGQSDI